MATSTDVPPLAKYLASPDKKTRDKAVKNLAIFLSNSSPNITIPDLEMAKLWKGIFYCFWMSDKPLVQQALASELAELLLMISDTPSALHFLRGFWITLVREWNGIDRLRMDKYYMLVRRFVNATFRLLMRTKWEDSACQEYNIILTQTGGPLCPDDIRVPVSLAFHISDIYLEELDKTLSAPSPAPAPLSTTLSPFFTLAARTQANTTYKHIQETLLNPLFAALKLPPAEEPTRRKLPRLESSFSNLVSNSCISDPSEGAVDAAKLRQALLRRMFEVASGESTRDSNRRKMYALFKAAKDDDSESHD